ncbi:recombinase family protein [Caproiciproducens sp. R1]|uniref:recombinase family protein n=1 Tax=Caproiciproducens sp. R1 TaxID=3435000 RepID=UPI004033408C
MPDRIKEGDTILIELLSRLGRSTKDLIELVELFEKKKVYLISLKESINTSTSTGKMLFTVISALAQFEWDVIAEQTKEELKSARVRGRMVESQRLMRRG